MRGLYFHCHGSTQALELSYDDEVMQLHNIALGHFGNAVHIPVDGVCLRLSSFKGQTTVRKRDLCKRMRE